MKVSVGSGFEVRTFDTEMDIGKTYIVSPINPLKKKHRGRICTLVAFVPYNQEDGGTPCFDVRFSDNGRRGRVDISDLVPTDK